MLQHELIDRVRALCAEDAGLDAALMYGSFTEAIAARCGGSVPRALLDEVRSGLGPDRS